MSVPTPDGGDYPFLLVWQDMRVKKIVLLEKFFSKWMLDLATELVNVVLL
jgi:hypothetical protein